MNVPITIEKPKFILDCFTLVIRYIPRGMDYDFVKEEISRPIASVINPKRIHYSYNRKTDDYHFHVQDLQEYNQALNMRRISIGNVMVSITQFLEGNKLTYCTRWRLGHMRNKCLAATARCRICLQEITDIQRHNCSQQPRCAQCDGNQGRNSVSKAGGRRPPISQDLEAGGRNMFVRMDLSLKYSQKRNFFHFFEQKKQNFQKQGV